LSFGLIYPTKRAKKIDKFPQESRFRFREETSAMSRLLFSAAGMSLLLISPVSAASVPILSGIYSISVTATCQATENSPGAIMNRLLTANFKNSKHIITVTGVTTYGSLVVPEGSAGGISQAAISYSSPFANTATTLTADHATVNVVYGPITQSNVALSYLSSGPVIEDGLSCVETATALRQ
jgi:hypothetical protein